MMQFLRNHMNSKPVKALFFVVTVAFVGTGASVFTSAPHASVNAVAEVNGSSISTEEFNQAYDAMIKQFNGQDLPDAFVATLKKQALDNLISERLLSQKVREMNLATGNSTLSEYVTKIPLFQKDGKFDQKTYETVLKTQMRTTPVIYEQSVREHLVLQELQNAILQSEVVGDESLALIAALEKQKRDIKIAALPLQNYLSKVSISDDEIKKYFDEHKASFKIGERVKLKYVEISDSALKASIKVSEDELKAIYDQKSARRSIQHIFLNLPANQKDDQANAKFSELFAMAKKVSIDELEVKAKELLGDKVIIEELEKLAPNSVGDADFDKAIFNKDVKSGDWLAPFYSKTGLHLVKIIDVANDASAKSFDMAKASLEEELKAAKAKVEYVALEGKFQQVLESSVDQLDDLAKAMDTQVQESDWLELDAQQGLLANPDVLLAVKSDEVFKQAKNSLAISLGANHAIALRLAAHDDARALTLDEVRDQIVQTLTAQSAQKLAQADAAKLLADIEKNTSEFEALAKQYNAEVKIVTDGYKMVNDSTFSPLVNASYIDAFEMGTNATVDKPLIKQAKNVDELGASIIVVSKVTLGNLDKDYTKEEREALKSRVVDNQRNIEFGAFLESMKDHAKVVKKMDVSTITK